MKTESITLKFVNGKIRMIEKYNPIKAGFLYTFSNMLIKAIPFLTLPIFTRLLTTEDFGIYNVYLSYESILSVIIGVGLSGTIRAASVTFTENFQGYISAILLLQILVAIIFFPIIIIAYLFMRNEWFSLHVLIFLVLQSLAVAFCGILINSYAITGKVKKNILLSFCLTLLNVGLSLILIVTIFSNNHYLGRIVGTSLSYFLVSIVFAFPYLKSLDKEVILNLWKYAVRLGIPLLPHLLSMVVFSQCDKIMIQKMLGNSAAGVYSLGVTIITVLLVIVTSIDNAWAPWFYGKLKNQSYSSVLHGNNSLSVLFFVITAGFILLLPDVVRFFSQEDYWGCIPSALILTISVFINFMYLFSVNTEYFFQKTFYISIFTLISVIVNVILNYICIQVWGYIGAAVATVIARFVLFLLHTLQQRRLLKEKVISHFILLIELCVLCLLVAISYIFRNNVIIRLCCIIPIIGLLVFIIPSIRRSFQNK